ncbi:MAG: hypothetical protein ACE3JK_18980 [Sporolactobacillus sp.]
MAEGKKKEPTIIHVDKLIIQADEVLIQKAEKAAPVVHAAETHRQSQPHVVHDLLGFPVPPFAPQLRDRTGDK